MADTERCAVCAEACGSGGGAGGAKEKEVRP